MSGFTVFVEGVADQKFIQDVIETHFDQPQKLNIQIKFFGGKDKWHLAKEDFRKSVNAGKTNLLIFDADNDPKKRREEIEEKKTELGIEFALFLFPNDRNSGELEDLLLQICSDKAPAIFGCFETYKDCIRQIDHDYTKPDLKTKLYAYSEITTGNGKEKERDYKNPENWDLKSETLTPLLSFLKRHLKE